MPETQGIIREVARGAVAIILLIAAIVLTVQVANATGQAAFVYQSVDLAREEAFTIEDHIIVPFIGEEWFNYTEGSSESLSETNLAVSAKVVLAAVFAVGAVVVVVRRPIGCKCKEA